MHPNPVFRKAETQRALGFARARSFGVLAVSTEDAPLFAHIPFLLSTDGSKVEMHLVRSNPIARLMAPKAATLVISGPDGYVSPDWYGAEDQVPTWNYVAVHVTGTLQPMPEDALEDLLARQSEALEAFLPKDPWTMDKMTDATRDRFLRMIVPFQMTVTDVQSTYKLNQNKPDEVRLRAARAVQDSFGSDLEELSDLMRVPPPNA